MIRKHYSMTDTGGGGQPATNFVHTVPDSHFWTSIEMLLNFLDHYKNGNCSTNYLIIGLQNTLKNGYDILPSPSVDAEPSPQEAAGIIPPDLEGLKSEPKAGGQGKSWNSSGSRLRTNKSVNLFGEITKYPDEGKARWAKILNMREYNKYFSIEDHIGSVISENEFQVLMAAEKIWITKCRMSGVEAARAMGKDVSDFAVDERTYRGLIVADTIGEAKAIAKLRGWGEEVEFVLKGIVSSDTNMINPYDLSKNNN